MQSILPLSSGGVLKVTIEEYLTPKLHKVNGVGITPDIEVQGSAAQMLAALHKLGMHDIQLSATKRSMTINQVEVMDSFHYIQEQGKVYVHSRLLAALIDGQIEWNGKEKAVEITKRRNEREVSSIF